MLAAAAHAADVAHERDLGHRVVGSLILAGAGETTFATVLGAIAVFASTTNIVGGFLITDRMLRMFKRREPRAGHGIRGRRGRRHERFMNDTLLPLAYLFAAACSSLP